jgi:mRNA-degrading endonuclease RelE of RelBE toxin-antitoxin system
MRTTLTLDPDVADKAKKGAAKLGKPFKEIINAALRTGLDQILNPRPSVPYRTKPRPLGLRRGLSYDNIGELLARAEGEDYL